MEWNILPVVPRRTRDGMLVCRDGIIQVAIEPQWEHVDLDVARLKFQAYRVDVNWPWFFGMRLDVAKYGIGCKLDEHTDSMRKDLRCYRIQFIPRNAARGGELTCEHFIANRRNFKVFEPGRWKHGVSEVLEGERFVLNLGVYWRRPLIRQKVRRMLRRSRRRIILALGA